jgi:hypothetical protein
MSVLTLSEQPTFVTCPVHSIRRPSLGHNNTSAIRRMMRAKPTRAPVLTRNGGEEWACRHCSFCRLHCNAAPLTRAVMPLAVCAKHKRGNRCPGIRASSCISRLVSFRTNGQPNSASTSSASWCFIEALAAWRPRMHGVRSRWQSTPQHNGDGHLTARMSHR